MRHSFWAGWLLGLLASPCLATPPNIVIVMADDLGYADLGCYGGEILTPHLDRLAENGVRFTQFYNTARCCPTRAALLTGVYPHQAGIGHMVANRGSPAYQGYLDSRSVTIAEALQPAGYTTLMTGKWHVGSQPGRWPLDRGFDRFFGTPSGGGVYFKESLQIRKNVFFVLDQQRVDIPDDFYCTDAFTNYALQFVNDAAQQQKPFFLYLAHIAPHWPLQAKPADIAKYQGKYQKGWDVVRANRFARQRAMKLVDPNWSLSPRDPRAQAWKDESAKQQRDLAHRMAVYAAQIDCIDQNVGRLLATLERHKLLDNTLIFFLSDNGCSAEGGPGGFRRGKPGAAIGTGLSYASLGLEWANVADTPFRKFKMNTHEGGIATPLIVHWPEGIARRGELEIQPGHVVDLLPTCLEVAGISYPKQRAGKATLPLAGQSLLPALRGHALPPRPLYWEHQGNRAIRVGDWKAVADHKQPWELYHLQRDRTETMNLAAQHPERLNDLRRQWDTWAQSVGVRPWPLKAPTR